MQNIYKKKWKGLHKNRGVIKSQRVINSTTVDFIKYHEYPGTLVCILVDPIHLRAQRKYDDLMTFNENNKI